MAQLSGVNIEKLEGGLARLAEGTDNHVGYVYSKIGQTAIYDSIYNDGKGVVIRSVFEAEQLGINESLEANEGVFLYEDIVDFFRLAPEATLYLFPSTSIDDVKNWINQNKEIKGFGFKDIPEDLTDDAVIYQTVQELQDIVNELAAANRLIDFVVVGFDEFESFQPNLFELVCPQVSVVVACEKPNGQVGVLPYLGMLAVRRISENAGSVDIIQKPLSKRGRQDYPLTDALLGRWTEAFLSDGRSIESLDKSELTAIINKGYIVAAQYEGYSGYFFENSYTCVERSSDFAYIENNRVWNKAARIIRATLLPRVKSKVKKDPNTGFMATTTVAYWKGLLENALEKMVISDDISGFEVAIDSKQIVNDTSPVKVRALVVSDGIVHEFEVAVGLTNNI